MGGGLEDGGVEVMVGDGLMDIGEVEKEYDVMMVDWREPVGGGVNLLRKGL